MSVARIPAVPVNARSLTDAVIAFAVGAMLAYVLLAVRIICTNKYRTAEEILRYTGLPTLAAVPKEACEASVTRRNNCRKGMEYL